MSKVKHKIMAHYSPLVVVNGDNALYQACFTFLANTEYMQAPLTWYVMSKTSKEDLEEYIRSITEHFLKIIPEFVIEMGPATTEEVANFYDLSGRNGDNFFKIVVDPSKITARSFLIWATMIRIIQEHQQQAETYLKLRKKYKLSPIKAYYLSIVVSCELGYFTRGNNHEIVPGGGFVFNTKNITNDFNALVVEFEQQNKEKLNKNGHYYGVHSQCEKLVTYLATKKPNLVLEDEETIDNLVKGNIGFFNPSKWIVAKGNVWIRKEVK